MTAHAAPHFSAAQIAILADVTTNWERVKWRQTGCRLWVLHEETDESEQRLRLIRIFGGTAKLRSGVCERGSGRE
jgi:hypothetical protein